MNDQPEMRTSSSWAVGSAVPTIIEGVRLRRPMKRLQHYCRSLPESIPRRRRDGSRDGGCGRGDRRARGPLERKNEGRHGRDHRERWCALTSRPFGYISAELSDRCALMPSRLRVVGELDVSAVTFPAWSSERVDALIFLPTLRPSAGRHLARVLRAVRPRCRFRAETSSGARAALVVQHQLQDLDSKGPRVQVGAALPQRRTAARGPVSGVPGEARVAPAMSPTGRALPRHAAGRRSTRTGVSHRILDTD